MKINGRISKSTSNSRFINGSLFHNNDYHYAWDQKRIPANTNLMRAAAKRFASSSKFDSTVSIYNCHIENGRWQFVPAGKRFPKTIAAIKRKANVS